MEINGRARLACQTPVIELDGEEAVTVRPMYNLPVIKDMLVDMEPFFDSYVEIDPAFEAENLDETSDPAIIPPDAPERHTIDPRTDCVGCGACYSGCSIAGGVYLSPAAINKALTLLNDSRDSRGRERLERLAADDGVFGCHTQGNCSRNCPEASRSPRESSTSSARR
jgi:succinate dehydrogenase/fumarate reductase iron-sulfur protein